MAIRVAINSHVHSSARVIYRCAIKRIIMPNRVHVAALYSLSGGINSYSYCQLNRGCIRVEEAAILLSDLRVLLRSINWTRRERKP